MMKVTLTPKLLIRGDTGHSRVRCSGNRPQLFAVNQVT